MKQKMITFVSILLLSIFVFSGCQIEHVQKHENKYHFEHETAILTEVPNQSTITKIEIPDMVEDKPVVAVQDFAAVNLENVETISIGKNVQEIGPWAFENNQKLKAFHVDENNPYFCDVDGVLFTKDQKTLLFYPPQKDVQQEEKTKEDGKTETISFSTYEIPQGVEVIRTKAFYKCALLKDVKIPDSVTRIEEKAFFRCSQLEQVLLPEKLTFIGKDAFSYCTAFTALTIPSSVTEIGTYAFYNCKALKNIEVQGKESEITLGEKWYPTDNGKNMQDLKITFAS